MSPHHELKYFDAKGRGEVIRICLHIANADWKDTRFVFKDWPSIKPNTPLGQAPVLTIDGVDHCQAAALMRYAGKLSGWYPSDPLEALVVDEVMDSMNELMSMAPRSEDKEEMKKLREEFQASKMTQYATFMEKIIQRNGGTGFVSKPSIADLALVVTVGVLEAGTWDFIDTGFYAKYPGIMATVKSIKENEQYKSYYEK